MQKHEQAYTDYIAGLKYKDIAAKYGVTVDVVKNWKRRYWTQGDTKKGVTEKSVKGVKQKVSPTQKVSPEKAQRRTDEQLLSSVEQNDQLTDKQRLFCLCYVKNFNATQAAINAGYSPETARFIGYENLTKPHIRAEIQRLKAIKEQSLLASQDDIVERYMHIAFADMTDFVAWGRETQPVIGMYGPVMVKNEQTGEKEILTQEVNTVRFRESESVDGGLVCQIKQGKDGVTIKLEDRQKALDWLGKYFLMNPLDRHRIDYDNARLELEKKKSESDAETAKPIKIEITRATKPMANSTDETDTLHKKEDV